MACQSGRVGYLLGVAKLCNVKKIYDVGVADGIFQRRDCCLAVLRQLVETAVQVRVTFCVKVCATVYGVSAV